MLDDGIVVEMPRRIHASRSSTVRRTSSSDNEPALTRSQIRELKRSVRDLNDRTRYLLVSAFSRRMVFYYDVTRDLWGMNDPTLGTPFKRRAAAEAVRSLLREDVRIIRCRVDRRERMIKKSVALVRPPWHGRTPERGRAGPRRDLP